MLKGFSLMYPCESGKGWWLIVTMALIASGIGIYTNATSPFWFDEVFTGAVACQPTFGKTFSLASRDVHPILYNGLVHFLFMTTSCNLWNVRYMSLAFSLGGVFLLARRTLVMGGNPEILVSLLLGNRVFWHESFEARSYALLFFSTCGVLYFSLSPRPGARLVAIGFALFGALLHYFAVFLFFLVLLCGPGSGRWSPRKKTYVIVYLTAAALIILYYSLQFGHFISTGNALLWPVRPKLLVLVYDTPAYLLGGDFPLFVTSAIFGLACYYLPSRHAIKPTIWLVLANVPIFATGLFLVSQVTRVPVALHLFPLLYVRIFVIHDGRPVDVKDKERLSKKICGCKYYNGSVDSHIYFCKQSHDVLQARLCPRFQLDGSAFDHDLHR